MSSSGGSAKPATVDEYVAAVPKQARPCFDELRELVTKLLPDAHEVLSYGILGYRTDDAKRCRVFLCGWKDHVAVYPVPRDPQLQEELKPYRRGKGTLWFALDQPLPRDLIVWTVRALVA